MKLIKSEINDELLENLKLSLLNNIPTLVTRFGSNELELYLNYRKYKRTIFEKVFRRFINSEKQIWSGMNFDQPKYYHAWGKHLSEEKSVNQFYIETNKAIKLMDLLGSWRPEETKIDLLRFVPKVPLYRLEPYYSVDPWSVALEGKKVLVISPFVDSIDYQYKHHRENLFNNQLTLPEFSLRLLKAPYHDDGRFNSWIDVSNFYKNQLLKTDFDAALLGNGCWGMTIGGFIKGDLKKSAIHLGGALQLLFGIYGNRWLDPNSRLSRAGLVNKFWKRPYKHEIPEYFTKVEGGCYW